MDTKLDFNDIIGEKDGVCPNCNRCIKLTKHHIIPLVKGGKDGPVMWICRDCHSQLHDLYDNNYLKNVLNTAERVLDNEAMRKFGKFAHKQTGAIKKRVPRYRRR